jgi:prephenate dehydratase
MMSKIYFQGTFGAYSHLAALSLYPKAEIIPSKTFDECFIKASTEAESKIIIPESNRITGNIGIEYLIFKYRLNIYAEHFQKIEHNLLGIPGSKLSEIKDVYSHAQALSQCSEFIKTKSLIEHIRADTAGSAEMISKNKDKSQAAIASSLSAEIYGLEILKKNIENESGNLTRFLIMGKNISQPEFTNKKYITSFLFKLKSKPAALYQSLGGFAINGVNLTKLQSYPERNSFDSFFFLCDLDGHIEDKKVQKSLEELGLHCEDFHVLGVFEADKLRDKKS